MIADKEQWWQPFRTIDEIAVFRIDLTPHLGREAEAFAWLDGEERSRWQRIQSTVARRRFVLCRAALRALLCRQNDCANESLTFGAAKHGKPFARVEGISATGSFNVSHSGQHGLIAISSGGRLGVDIEERASRKNLDNLIEGVFSPQERAELKRLDDCQKLFQFFRFWTIKEALVKAHGKGLSMKVAELEIPAAMRHGSSASICQFPQIPNTAWHLIDIGTDDFAAAIVYEAEPAS